MEGDLEAASQRVVDAAQAGLAADEYGDGSGQALVTGLVAVVSYIDSNGDQCLAKLSSDLPSTAELGLLRAAVLCAEETVRDWWYGEA